MVLDPWIWSVVLMLAGMMLIVLEIFIPSGGIIGLLSFGCVTASIGLAFFHYGSDAGFASILLALLTVPAVVVAALKLLPKTPMGRRLLLGDPSMEDVLPDDEKLVGLKALIGKTGTAKSKMLPSGSVEIDGRIYDAVSEGMPIDPEQPVRVVSVRTNRVIVRPALGREKLDDARTGDDLLSQPFESLGLDTESDPLA